MKQFILGVNPCVNGLNYHDPSVCLLDEQEIVFAIEEERLNRVKHARGDFPKLAVNTCKSIVQSCGGTITDIAIGYDPSLWKSRSALSFVHDNMKSNYYWAIQLKSLCALPNARVTFYEHHLSHAASAFYSSGYNNSLCIVFDGVGELAAASAWVANNETIIKIDEVFMPNSLGYFYAMATAFAGFEPWNQEGKLMALAPYGRPDAGIRSKLGKYFSCNCESYDVSSLVSPCLHDGFVLDIAKALVCFEHLFGHAPRVENEPINTWFQNFAFEIQSYTERSVVQYINRFIQSSSMDHVCAAGGLFMNCKMNGVIRDRIAAKHFYVQPVAGDNGTALGAAFLKANQLFRTKPTNYSLQDLSLGISYSDNEAVQLINASNKNLKIEPLILKEIAQLLAKGKIVVWFQGRSEMSARALGHRSILADPRTQDMADIVNEKVKHREQWRPFACSILDDYSEEVLLNYNRQSMYAGYMVEAYKVNPLWKNKMCGVTHSADATTRPQVVRNTEQNSKLYQLLLEFMQITGCPFVMNTSLNDKGQPIIQTPQQAIDFFVSHNVDILIVGDFQIKKGS